MILNEWENLDYWEKKNVFEEENNLLMIFADCDFYFELMWIYGLKFIMINIFSYKWLN